MKKKYTKKIRKMAEDIKDIFPEVLDSFYRLMDMYPPRIRNVLAKGIEMHIDDQRETSLVSLIYRYSDPESRELLESCSVDKNLLERIVIEVSDINYVAPFHCRNAIKLIHRYKKDPSSSVSVARDIKDGYYAVCGNKTGIKDLLEVYEKVKDKPRSIHAISNGVHSVAWNTEHKFTVEQTHKIAVPYLLAAYNTLNPEFDPLVYEDLAKYLCNNLGSAQKIKSIVNTIAYKHGFMNRQKPETVIPLAVILTELPEKHHKQIMKTDQITKLYLAQAYSIAQENINEKTFKNFMPSFYKGLNDVLDSRPEMLKTWAKTIVDEFQKKTDKGLFKVIE